ncbi:hypothetical protein [Rhodococcus triatomae]
MNRTIASRVAAIAAAAALVATAAGCGNDDDQAAPATTAAISSSTAPPSSTPAPSAVQDLGSEVAFTSDGFALRVTVQGFDPAAAPDAPAPPGGGHWAAAEVRTCVDTAPSQTTVNWSPWSVLDTTDGRYPASDLTYNQFPLPEYPFGSEPVNVGECVRGWVVFPVADGAVINRVRYAPNESVVTTWNVANAAPPVDVPYTTSVEPEPTAVEQPAPPASGGVAAVGQPCSSPSSVGVDVNTGDDIVCVFMGSGGGNVWVQTAPIVGVNNVGESCNDGDNVSRTPDGKAIMCVQGKWTYGP